MGTPFKMKGSPMQRNFGVGVEGALVGVEGALVGGAMQSTKGKLKKTFIGPIKPMTDKDGDGIPIGIDIKDSPGGKQSSKKHKLASSNKPKKTKKTKPVTNNQKQGFNYDPIPSVKDNA